MTGPFDPPPEMRDFAERSIAQARKAFEGFMGAVQKGAEAVTNSPLAPPAAARDLSDKATAFTQANVNAAFDLAQKLVHAKDPQEAFALQSAYLKAQFEALQAQAGEMGVAIQSAATKAMKP